MPLPEFWHPGMGGFPPGSGMPMPYPFDPHMGLQQGGVFPQGGPLPMIEGVAPMMDPYGNTHPMAMQPYWPMHGGMPVSAGFPQGGGYPPACYPEQHMAAPVHSEHTSLALQVGLGTPSSLLPPPTIKPMSRVSREERAAQGHLYLQQEMQVSIPCMGNEWLMY